MVISFLEFFFVNFVGCVGDFFENIGLDVLDRVLLVSFWGFFWVRVVVYLGRDFGVRGTFMLEGDWVVDVVFIVV